MKYLSGIAKGFVYSTARKGVTGAGTDFTRDMAEYLFRCRKTSSLPLAVGFGISGKTAVDYLTGKVDIAVIGTQSLRIMEKDGIHAVGDFIKGLQVS